MCRLYGFLATDPTRLDCSLVEAQNSLQVQSDRDGRGVRNADGWGIAHWLDDDHNAFRSTMPAFADSDYADVVSNIWSTATIAHVRAATVGNIAIENTHPFTVGAWAFAHNGHISGFDQLETRLDYGPLGTPEGATDSEAAFVWIAARMNQYGLDIDEIAPSLDPVVDLVADAVLELVDMALAAGAPEQPRLNFVLTDGHHMVASRWGNTLYWNHRRGLRDCAVCKLSHCPNADESYRSVSIASEILTEEEWHEIPEGSVLGVDVGARVLARDLVAEPLAS